MTFTIQEVPQFSDIADEFSMNNMTYDMTLSEICQLQPDEVKLEDPYVTTMQFTTPTTSMPLLTGSPSLPAPPPYEQFNPYLQINQMESTASPSNMYANSPASTTYSPQPQQQYQQMADDFTTFYQTPAARLPQYSTPPQVVPQAQAQADFMYYGGGYENYGVVGKRRLRDDELTPQEYQKRCQRRARNREAALRCRTRRRERIEVLEKEVEECEAENRIVELEIADLQKELKNLKDLLENHVCHIDIKNTVDSVASTAVKSEPSL